MATKTTRYQRRSPRTGNLGSIATLIGVYTAFYLAVIGVIHFMSSPDAAAAMAPDATVEQTAAPHLPPEANSAPSRLSAVPADESGAPDNSRECAPDANIKTECIYN